MKNMKKTILKLKGIELAVATATIAGTPKFIELGTATRGYSAIGGEYLLPLAGFLVILVIEGHISDIKYRYAVRKQQQLKKAKAKKAKVMKIDFDTKDMTLQEIQSLRNIKAIVK